MKAKKLPEQEYLNNLFNYDEVSGKLFWKISKARCVKIGDVVGSYNRGYLRVRIDGGQFYVHRLIWKMIHGTEPEELDHINGNPRDNRLKNLRVLCPNCHSLKPSHRGRNKKKTN